MTPRLLGGGCERALLFVGRGLQRAFTGYRRENVPGERWTSGIHRLK